MKIYHLATLVKTSVTSSVTNSWRQDTLPNGAPRVKIKTKFKEGNTPPPPAVKKKKPS
jgi:hypothetical protein